MKTITKDDDLYLIAFQYDSKKEDSMVYLQSLFKWLP